jgi:hypothetical protein
MNAPKQEPVGGLTPEAVALVETYFTRVHGALLVAATDQCEETVEDLRAHVYEELEGSAGTAADVTRVLAELGPPEALAAQCAGVAAGAESAASEPEPEERFSRLHGRVLGVPYDLRMPTATRVVSLWWNPLDPHVFVPRVFGLGWTINFGAVSVLLGIVRPDDEDVPFAAVPERYVAIALVLPLLIAALLGTLIVMHQGALPAQVAVHWGVTGAPDQFASKESALIVPVCMTLFGLVLAGATWVRCRQPVLRVGAGALATMLGSISVAAYAQQVATAYGASDAGVLLPGLALSLLLTFGLLVTLSRIGHAAEVRRDLDRTTKKGSV